MIPCRACGAANEIMARYCRSCGVKLEVGAADVQQAVGATRSMQDAQRWLQRGGSLLAVALFLLTCALVVRYVLVPPMPAAQVPPADAGGIVPPPPAAPR